jgi:6-pyruvoyl-tetrahydropterin synthase
MSGFVDKVERVDRAVIVERRPRKRQQRGASAVRAPGPTEEQIQRTVIEWLQRRAVKDLLFYHVPNGELRHKAVAAKLKAMGVLEGVGDIVLHYRGHTYFLEIKVAGGVQSSAQEHFEHRAERAGCTYAVARGLDYALDTLRDWGLLQ